jgi:hypothetical protein
LFKKAFFLISLVFHRRRKRILFFNLVINRHSVGLVLANREPLSGVGVFLNRFAVSHAPPNKFVALLFWLSNR